MNRRYPRRKNRGMTLIEIMITTALLSMVGVALTATLIGSVRGWSSGVGKENTTSNVTIAMQKLSMEIRDGSSASVSNNILTVTFPATITDGTETVYDRSTASSVTRSYYISEGNLVRSVSGTVSVLGYGVTSATFGTTGGAVSITLESEEQVGTYTASRSISGNVGLRNYRD